MSDKFMHVIDGKAITKHNIGYIFVHSDPKTGKSSLCKLYEISDIIGDAVYVEYYIPRSITHTKWSKPELVYCKELHWYKMPSFTAEDLLK